VKKIKAASVVACVGSLTTANIRFANDETGTIMTGHYEIVSLVGQIDMQVPAKVGNGSGHVHISISDETGRTIGGHLLEGSLVYTTAEITLLELVDGLFKRVLDDGPQGSGYEELKVFASPGAVN
jgi:predicted DNA-binding protein with PD1-like motif